MPYSLIPSFLIYCFVGAITPGPANLCSLSAALRYGRRAALKQWGGIFVGFACVSMASVLVTRLLGEAFDKYVGVLSWIGAAYLLWMAISTLLSSKGEGEKSYATPSFLTGLFVQLTNVKIMVFCMTALSVYVLPHSNSFFDLLAVGLFLPFTGPVANLVWLFAGASLKRVFEKHRKALDIIMAIALAACALSLVVG